MSDNWVFPFSLNQMSRYLAWDSCFPSRSNKAVTLRLYNEIKMKYQNLLWYLYTVHSVLVLSSSCSGRLQLFSAYFIVFKLTAHEGCVPAVSYVYFVMNVGTRWDASYLQGRIPAACFPGGGCTLTWRCTCLHEWGSEGLLARNYGFLFCIL